MQAGYYPGKYISNYFQELTLNQHIHILEASLTERKLIRRLYASTNS